MSERYLTLDLGYFRDEQGDLVALRVDVKLDDEGVVVDVSSCPDAAEFHQDDIIATTWKLYDEFGVETIKFKEDK